VVASRERICQIHCTNEVGVWLEHDPKLNLPLDETGGSGWLVIERSSTPKIRAT